MGRNSFIITILALFFCTEVQAQQKHTRKEYIDKYKETAISQMKSHGIPASITLAQGCLESGDGNSQLAVKANNHFGIKCHNDWKGQTFHQDDDEKHECFRKYKNAADSFDDHAEFIRGKDRYAFLFDIPITDYKAWCYGLKKAGYATHPKYAEMLIKIIEDYNLYDYDREVSGKAKVSDATSPSTPQQLEGTLILQPTDKSPFYKYSANRTIYIKNRTAFIVANGNDTYQGIAQEYHLFTRELLMFNDLQKDIPIKAGTVIYLQKKKKQAQHGLNVHIVDAGETYYDIAQRYAVRLSCIYKYNDIKKGSQPQEDDRIILRKAKK